MSIVKVFFYLGRSLILLFTKWFLPTTVIKIVELKFISNLNSSRSESPKFTLGEEGSKSLTIGAGADGSNSGSSSGRASSPSGSFSEKSSGSTNSSETRMHL